MVTLIIVLLVFVPLFLAVSVIGFIALSFFIIAIASIAGFISGSVSGNALKGIKVFLALIGALYGYIAGSLSYLTLLYFIKNVSPQSIAEALYMSIPGSVIGTIAGIVIALIVNLGLVKIIELVKKNTAKTKAINSEQTPS